MELIPVQEKLEDNQLFISDPDCAGSVGMCVDFYKKVGFNVPWICDYAKLNSILVGCAGYKGKPTNGRIEIAYGTFPQHMQKGIGAMIAATLVQLSLKTDPSIIITAKTLPQENYSTRILRKNNFKLLGVVFDEEDGDLWDWEYIGPYK